MKKLSIITWCWLWYLLAQCADMVTSLARWGGEEENPFFRNSLHQFMAWHAALGKTNMMLAAASLSYLAYRVVAPLDKRVATVLACALPLYFGWELFQIANDNLFYILQWVNN